MTYGEKLVGITFNPSNKSEVTEVKDAAKSAAGSVKEAAGKVEEAAKK